MTEHALVPADFVVPTELITPLFRLEPLGPQHNAADHAAWSAGIEHIRATPGFEDREWPPVGGMTLEANLHDLQKHADDFAQRRGFTYTVIGTGIDVGDGDGDGGDYEVIGCVYIYPARGDGQDPRPHVSSWVRADRAELDAPLHAAVSDWLATDWPLGSVRYAPR
ncbi:N-acetyltransferase [Streptomyces sp. A 4/2]|uniref:N-acetyltransferase n=1 Tax=Streptomyces sp. A 4/2 TaxID=2934314 RepID=UPI0020251A19|nr:N-acetyltransferase [Streptomyces sp. A 4/2]